MTRSPDQRLDIVEDEFETVKQLLTSAARYAESANEKIDRLSERQDRTQVQLDQLSDRQDRTQVQLDRLSEKQDRTQVQLDQLSSKVDELTAAQAQTQTQLNQLASRVDEFVFQAQRLFTQQGERLIQVEGLTESLTGIVQRLDRNYEAQQSQQQEFQRTTEAALARIDRVVDYLLRQKGGES